MSREGRGAGGSATDGGAASGTMSSGWFDMPANQNPAASAMAEGGASIRTGPATRWAAATAAFWAAVSVMTSDASASVMDSDEGSTGGFTAAPARCTRFAPLASSMAISDMSMPPRSMCSVNLMEIVPRPMSRTGRVPGSRAGGVESSTVVMLAPASANALPDRSAIPAPDATSRTSGAPDEDAFACLIASFCVSLNANCRRVPFSDVDSDRGCQDAGGPAGAATLTLAGATPATPTYSSKSSVSVPVARLRNGAEASAGALPSGIVRMESASMAGRALPDASRTAPADVTLTDALPAVADVPRAPTTCAFC